MSKRMDEDSREILSYRPNITFIEPESVEQAYGPFPEVPTQIEDIQKKREEVKQLAKTVNTLATVLQARADGKAKNMKIRLDPKVDAAAIMAMRRLYPDDDSLNITYDQYKICKDRLMNKGLQLGQQVLITPESIAAVKNQDTYTSFGGWDTEDSKNGFLRPEINSKMQIVPHIDLFDLQDSLIKIFVNFIKNGNQWELH